MNVPAFSNWLQADLKERSQQSYRTKGRGRMSRIEGISSLEMLVINLSLIIGNDLSASSTTNLDGETDLAVSVGRL